MEPTRRDLILGAAAGIAVATIASPALSAPDDSADLEAAFRAAFAPSEKGRPGDARLAFLAADALVIDHDVPFPMTRAEYADHLGFQSAQWERYELTLRDIRVTEHGATAVVTAFFNERGKPVDSGFRLRPGYCTAVCSKKDGKWQALSLHLSPLLSQIVDASPS